MADDNEGVGNAKLIQYLTEAHGKEKELQDSLEAHSQIATKDAYKKRLKDHLKETKQHAKLVERRVKKLGGNVSSSAPAKVVEAPQEIIKRGAAAAKGAGHVIRGTGDEEKQLKNAKTEYFNEHEEIANYTAIETLATALGDTETAKMAKGIRREEERMASFLEKQIPALTKALVKAEVPASERASSSSRKRRSSSKSRASTSSRSTSSGTKSSSGRKSSARSSSSSKRSSSSRSSGRKAKSSS